MHGGDRPHHDLRPFTVGEWHVFPMHRRIERSNERRTLEPRHVDVLAYLASHADEVIGVERLLQACWGNVFHGDNPVHKTIAMLRKALGDDARSPRYIATVRKRGYQLIAKVDQAASSARVIPTPTRMPYRGRLPYGVDDAGVFFGRARATAELRDILFDSRAHDRRVVVVHGASGCGKTSLVHAGLLASLCTPSARHEFPLAAWMQVTPHSGDDVQDVLAAARTHERVILVADGIERMHPSMAPMLDRFVADPRVMIVATCRHTELATMRRHPSWAALMRGSADYAVSAPSAGEIASIIRDPARACGLRFGRDPVDARQLDDVLLHDAWKHAGSLPALQYLLRRLCEARDHLGVMPFEAYRAIGGIDGALARDAARRLLESDSPRGGVLPRLLRRLVCTATDGVFRSQPVPYNTLDDEELALADELVESRLLASQLVDGRACITAPRPSATMLLADALPY